MLDLVPHLGEEQKKGLGGGNIRHSVKYSWAQYFSGHFFFFIQLNKFYFCTTIKKSLKTDI